LTVTDENVSLLVEENYQILVDIIVTKINLIYFINDNFSFHHHRQKNTAGYHYGN